MTLNEKKMIKFNDISTFGSRYIGILSLPVATMLIGVLLGRLTLVSRKESASVDLDECWFTIIAYL